jgi:hypothetical protein
MDVQQLGGDPTRKAINIIIEAAQNINLMRRLFARPSPPENKRRRKRRTKEVPPKTWGPIHRRWYSGPLSAKLVIHVNNKIATTERNRRTEIP